MTYKVTGCLLRQRTIVLIWTFRPEEIIRKYLAVARGRTLVIRRVIGFANVQPMDLSRSFNHTHEGFWLLKLSNRKSLNLAYYHSSTQYIDANIKWFFCAVNIGNKGQTFGSNSVRIALEWTCSSCLNKTLVQRNMRNNQSFKIRFSLILNEFLNHGSV